MNFKSKYCFHFLFVVLCVVGIQSKGISQDALAKYAATERNTDLSYSTGVQLTLSGTKVFSEFKLVDDLGLEYDIMSLLKNEDVRKEIQLTDDQFAKMQKIKSNLHDELAPQIVNGINSDEIGKVLEARVKAAELSLLHEMVPEQVTRLEQVKNQIRVTRFGAAKLASSRFLETELNLNKETTAKIRSSIETVEKAFLKKQKELYSQANQKIVDSLGAKKKKKLNNIVSPEFLDRFFEQKLFLKKPKTRFRKSVSGVFLIDLLNDKRIREELEMVDSQFKSVQKLKRKYDELLAEQTDELLGGEAKKLSITQRGKQLSKLNLENRTKFEKELADDLLPHQLKRLTEIAIQIETKKTGTVNCFCSGIITEQLSIDESAAKKLYEFSKKVHLELEKSLKELKSELDKKVVQLIPNFSMAERLGAPVEFELR